MINCDTIRIKFTEAYNYTTWVQYEHRIKTILHIKRKINIKETNVLCMKEDRYSKMILQCAQQS